MGHCLLKGAVFVYRSWLGQHLLFANHPIDAVSSSQYVFHYGGY